MSAEPQNLGDPESAQAVAKVSNPFASSPIVAAPSGAVEAALVQREVAEVQAAMAIAQRFRRNPVAAMDAIINECTRPTLADAAVYEYSRGGTSIQGASIRLAEVLARNWGNLACGVTELARRNGVSECLAYAWDLETNFRDEKRFQVKHWRDTKQGGYVLTDERDIYELIANMGARRKRACILAVIPGDVTEAALQQCDTTLRTNVKLTPERVKSMLEKFAEYGVTEAMVEKRIQRRLDALTPALFVNLGKVYNSLKDGMSQPADWFDMAPPPAVDGGPGEPTPTRTESVKDKLRGKKAGKDAPPDKREPVPGFNEDAAVKLIRGSETAPEFDSAKNLVMATLNGAEVPIAVNAAIEEMAAHFAEAAGK